MKSRRKRRWGRKGRCRVLSRAIGSSEKVEVEGQGYGIYDSLRRGKGREVLCGASASA